MQELISTSQKKWPGRKIIIVEPIGRKFKDDDKTDIYQETVSYVRENLSNIHDLIAETKDLHSVTIDKFRSDWVHLKPKGVSALCSCLKRSVYVILGLEYSPPSRHQGTKKPHHQSNNQSNNFRNKRNVPKQRRDNQGFSGQGRRSDDLSSVMRSFEQNLRGLLNL